MTLQLSSRLQRSLATTNAAENLLSRSILEAVKGFRRVKGYADMPLLVAALRARDQQLGPSTRVTSERVA